jgi:hypothetical protein
MDYEQALGSDVLASLLPSDVSFVYTLRNPSGLPPVKTNGKLQASQSAPELAGSPQTKGPKGKHLSEEEQAKMAAEAQQKMFVDNLLKQKAKYTESNKTLLVELETTQETVFQQERLVVTNEAKNKRLEARLKEKLDEVKQTQSRQRRGDEACDQLRIQLKELKDKAAFLEEVAAKEARAAGLSTSTMVFAKPSSKSEDELVEIAEAREDMYAFEELTLRSYEKKKQLHQSKKLAMTQ